MKLAVPDLISNSYFPAIAAVELGFFKREGLDVSLELIVPIEHALAAMRDGSLEFVGCSAHLLVAGFPEWRDVKLLCAQAQGMYWFLVMRSDLGARRGDLAVLKGRRIGAAHWVAMGLRRLLAEAGIDAERDAVTIAPIPGAHGAGTNFGVSAAQALEEGKVDGFWANGMGAELAVRRGVGTVVLDARRGDGPAGCFDYTLCRRGGDGRFHRTLAGGRRRGGPRDRPCAGGAPGQCGFGVRRRPQLVSRERSRAHRGSDPTRSTLLRCRDLARLRRGHDAVLARPRHPSEASDLWGGCRRPVRPFVARPARISQRSAGQLRSSGSTGRGWNSIPSSCNSLA